MRTRDFGFRAGGTPRVFEGRGPKAECTTSCAEPHGVPRCEVTQPSRIEPFLGHPFGHRLRPLRLAVFDGEYPLPPRRATILRPVNVAAGDSRTGLAGIGARRQRTDRLVPGRPAAVGDAASTVRHGLQRLGWFAARSWREPGVAVRVALRLLGPELHSRQMRFWHFGKMEPRPAHLRQRRVDHPPLRLLGRRILARRCLLFDFGGCGRGRVCCVGRRKRPHGLAVSKWPPARAGLRGRRVARTRPQQQHADHYTQSVSHRPAPPLNPQYATRR
jgi:hypothetical protein